MKLKNRVAIISGGSMGLGFEIAKQFVQAGAHVMLCARNAEPLRRVQEELMTMANGKTRVLVKNTDVSDPHQVDELISATIMEFGKVDILVANAAISGTKGPVEENDWQEWSRVIDINLKGTVLQCRAVLSHMKKQRYGKIIVLSGGGATKPMPNLSAYAASKAGVVRFAETLSEEVKEFNIDVNALAPGGLNTRFLDDALAAGPEKIGKQYYEQLIKQKENGGTPLTQGAALCLFLASRESDGITGKLLSAVWDPWENLQDYIQELKKSDIYTLRRILPEDRGQHWKITS